MYFVLPPPLLRVSSPNHLGLNCLHRPSLVRHHLRHLSALLSFASVPIHHYPDLPVDVPPPLRLGRCGSRKPGTWDAVGVSSRQQRNAGGMSTTWH
ncbi:hypothetical protein HA466_0068810 [Hirschfeldia incana]|nr:hypothetical protein HA466_0068810 [Hirschfeldia incana]